MQKSFENLIFSPVKDSKENITGSTLLQSQIFSSQENINFEDFLISKNDSIEENDEIDNISFLENSKLLSSDSLFPIKNQAFSKKEPLDDQASDVGCKCKNSNCLRLHCSCFKTLGYCGPSCKCQNCRNQQKYDGARQFVINKTKMIYKKAFKPKTAQIETIRDVQINIDGCNCSKGCENQYCGCKKIGGVCSPICRCQNCKNHKIDLSKEEIRSVYRPCSRKKHKLIFNFKDGQKNNTLSQNIIFEKYKTQKTI